MLGKEKTPGSPEFRETLPPNCGLSGSHDIIPIPASAEAVAQLQLLASSHIVDLEAITNVIGNDAGLRIQVLQLSARKCRKEAESISSLSELIVFLGLEQLRIMAAQVTLTLPVHLRR